MCLAIPGKIMSINDDPDPFQRVGKISFQGIIKEIQLAFTPEAVVGDYVLVHVGVSIARINEAEALRTLDYLKTIGELNESELGVSER